MKKIVNFTVEDSFGLKWKKNVKELGLNQTIVQIKHLYDSKTVKIRGRNFTRHDLKINLKLSFHKLKSYSVPDVLWDYIETHTDFNLVYPILHKSLTFDNYKEKFDLLLHIEECQNHLNMMNFTLEKAVMKKEILNNNFYLTVKVKGLDERRPSILKGDKVNAYYSNETNDKYYEGIIHEVKNDFNLNILRLIYILKYFYLI